jgi:hypothetical protein
LFKLKERRKVLYWSSRQDAFLYNLPQGFVVGDQGALCVVFATGNMKYIPSGNPYGPIFHLPLSFPSHGNEWLLARCAVRRTPSGHVAILNSHGDRTPTEQFRQILLFSFDGRELGRVRLAWSGWYPSGQSFLCTQDGGFVLPHDPDLDHVLEQYPVLFDRYDREGQLIHSFGPTHAEDDELDQRMVLASDSGSGFWAVNQCSYKISRFDAKGTLVWERENEIPHESLPQEHMPEISSMEDFKAWLCR